MWAALYVVLFGVLIGLAVVLGWAFWVAVACLLVVALAAGYVYFIGSMWWITGAGEPILLLDGGLVHGRIRTVAKGDAAGTSVANWWDFVVPAHEVTAVRLTGSDSRPARRTLVVELPAETSLKLVTDPATAWYAKRWLGRSGSPATWPVGRMLRRRGRSERLHELLVELQTGATDRLP
ncbi:MAG TPA: hypothetical protein VGL39_19560 [Jatrophihabitantaceae bacterium]